MSERAPKNPNPSEPTGAQHGGLIPDNERPQLTIEQQSLRPGRRGTRIELFTGAARMTGAGFQIEFTGANFTYEVTGDRAVFSGTGPDQERLLFGVREDDAVIFRRDPQGLSAPQTGEWTPNRGEGPRPPARPAVESHTAAEGIPVPRPRAPADEPVAQRPSTPAERQTQPPPLPATAAEDEPPADTLPQERQTSPATPEPGPADLPATEAEAERVQLTGRLGRNPSFRTTKNGALVGKFPLAVHHEDGNTSWHTVLAFGDRAKQLQHRVEAGELAQGREVDVVGYLHTNERPGRNGRPPRQVQEVYAVAVKKR